MRRCTVCSFARSLATNSIVDRLRAATEAWLNRVWYGRASAFWLLVPLSACYRFAIGARRWLYRSGLTSSGHPGVPVIVVGNITVGGTGKTPFVIWLITQLKARGRRPGIVSRGYRRAANDELLLVSDVHTARDAGDEPIEMFRRSDVPICVGKDRLAAGRRLAELGVDVIVADDGLQHYRLARDIEIAIVDGERGLGNGAMLPAGPLREPSSRLEEVDVVVTHRHQGDARSPGFYLEPSAVLSLDGKQRVDLAHFRQKAVWALAGIANPDRFFAMLTDADIDVRRAPVADHGTVSLRALADRDALPVVMTEKDAVKYSDCHDLDAWFVRTEIRMDQTIQQTIDRLLDERLA